MQKLAFIVMVLGLMAGFGALTQAQTGDQKVGQHFDIMPDAMPAPYATRSAANTPDVIARPAHASLHLPPGFTATLFADGLSNARWLTVAKNGDVFLAEPDAGKITLLRDSNGEGKADLIVTFAGGFELPHGLAFHDSALYVADMRAAWRIPYADGALKGTSRTAVTPAGSFGTHQGHWTRNIAFDSKGRMFIAIGSSANVTEDAPPRATVQVFENGKMRTFASGLRNAVGIALYPGTDDLFAVINERDGLGDGLVPDYLTHLVEGGFYGWPYAYIGHHPDPKFGAKRPDLVAKSIVPDLLFQAHSAPLGLVFYEGNQFPASYRGDAFVSLHGSWNAAHPTGYKIVRVPFRNGRPAGGYDNFATGFWAQGAGTAAVWGRPVGLAVAKDGSLLVADDTGNAVWRIAYAGK